MGRDTAREMIPAKIKLFRQSEEVGAPDLTENDAEAVCRLIVEQKLTFLAFCSSLYYKRL